MYTTDTLTRRKVTQHDVDKNVALEKRICQLQSLAIRSRRRPAAPPPTQPSTQQDTGAPPNPRDHAVQIWMPEAHGRRRAGAAAAAGGALGASAGEAPGLLHGAETLQLEEPLLTSTPPGHRALASDAGELLVEAQPLTLEQIMGVDARCNTQDDTAGSAAVTAAVAALPAEKSEFVRLRHHFIDDALDCSQEVIPHDFDFGLYLKMCLARNYADIVDISPADWMVL